MKVRKVYFRQLVGGCILHMLCRHSTEWYLVGINNNHLTLF
jgi:hypothetical protein